MWQVFGGYWEYKRIPKIIAMKQKLRLFAKWEVEKEINDEAERKYKEGR